jgi:hypothetical protein
MGKEFFICAALKSMVAFLWLRLAALGSLRSFVAQTEPS